jgi:hypothetical protein
MPRKMAREPNTTAEDSSSTAPAAPSKISVVLELLRREQGATLAELVDDTGWLPHTTRAALTGLRKKGHNLEKSKRGDVTCYRIIEAG